MIENEFLQECELEMEEVIDSIRRELSQVRTGRASPALLDGILVEAYGTKTPLRQLANVSIPEARLIVIQPWDKSIIGEMEKAIQKSELGINPTNDGKLIRLNVPPLTEERRRELVKLTKKIGEEGKIRLRSRRRESVESLKQAQKDGALAEDESHTLQEEVQKLTDQYVEMIDKVLEEKEHEIMHF